MNCLTNYIGLRDCTTTPALSGLYINDFPSMQTELLEKISSPEQASYAGVWDSVQRVAYQRLKTDVQAALFKSAFARLDQVLFQTSKQFVQDWQQIEVLPASAQYRGVFVSVEGSKYLGMTVKQIYIYNAGQSTVNDVPISIFQTQDGKVLHSMTADLQVGMNYVQVNKTFYSDFDKINIMVAVDCTDLDTTQGQFVDFGWNQMDIECAQPFTYLWQNGWNIFPVIAPLNYGLGQSWTQSNSQSGVYMDAQLICSVDAFICAQREFLTYAWGNLLCHQILWAKMGSPRANYFAQGNREYTERAMATMQDSYKETLAVWANQLNLRDEGLCFNCEAAGSIQQGFVRP
jgi:hypothetical protein